MLFQKPFEWYIFMRMLQLLLDLKKHKLYTVQIFENDWIQPDSIRHAVEFIMNQSRKVKGQSNPKNNISDTTNNLSLAQSPHTMTGNDPVSLIFAKHCQFKTFLFSTQIYHRRILMDIYL